MALIGGGTFWYKNGVKSAFAKPNPNKKPMINQHVVASGVM
jgi:hypothetical protein